jgi:hypothetical protein
MKKLRYTRIIRIILRIRIRIASKNSVVIIVSRLNSNGHGTYWEKCVVKSGIKQESRRKVIFLYILEILLNFEDLEWI